jgi:ribosomal protein S18 acetylase RimI-like enzyme
MSWMDYRHARRADAHAIAALHSDSWRRNYRGAYVDSYLDGDVESERLELWTDRLSHSRDDRLTIVADRNGRVVGFVHTILDDDPTWGAYLENLHVAHDFKRGGIGASLVVSTARELVERRPGSGLYLWVLEQNVTAQAFYDALGGTCTGKDIRGPFPGGGTAPGLRYTWPEPRRLFQAS